MDTPTSGPRSAFSSPPAYSTPASSPPPEPELDLPFGHAEEAARIENDKAEAKKRAAARAKARRKSKRALTAEEKAQKARELDDLLKKTAAFSDILTGKTRALGRMGTAMSGQSLGEHNLELAKQPKCMVGGKMHDYQLEGLTWMREIAIQGMSGILADEMGLGKTVQTISLVASLRESDDFYGPFLIVAPLSTLSNWIEEFNRWAPTVPVIVYHGTPSERASIWGNKVLKHYKGGRPDKKFPVVLTSNQIILRDRLNLAKIGWEFILIDEGHCMKNADAKLYQELRTFTSATRFLITGTPLQNEMKELWSLLHFLLPSVFQDWEAFDSWFDFTDLEDETGMESFITDENKHELMSKIHVVLQPLMLRRVKADVAAYLPKKREYILYAPLTREQTDLYKAISDKSVDTRAYLEDMVFKEVTESSSDSRESSLPPRKANGTKTEKALAIRESPRKPKATAPETQKAPATNAFSLMMGKKGPGRPKKNAEPVPAKKAIPKDVSKRKSPPSAEAPAPKSSKSSRESTPGGTRLRTRAAAVTDAFADVDEDLIDDDEFEARLVREYEAKELRKLEATQSNKDFALADSLEIAKKEISKKKLGNPIMQLRLVCNSPHNFYNPWTYSEKAVDESVVTKSGKMLLLDRLLPSLFRAGHKVLIFSQFKTQLDILADYCELRKWSACRLDGSVGQESRREMIKTFNTDPETRVFLLSTRAGGQGINLMAADTVILFDSDWNPQQDLQAQDRCHRIGQKRPVIIYRLATKRTVEEDLLLTAEAKRRLEKLVIRKGTLKTMGKKLDEGLSEIDKEALRALLLKDGEVYKYSGSQNILSDGDIATLMDRYVIIIICSTLSRLWSDAAYEQAARGDGNADVFKVIETGANGIKEAKAS
ncbi:related to proliferation associated SNF2-like protein [Cephalotrichum gorgonifer]|uniref:Related to proliferation associated SNF2-like protein n=1 Tax=Cephalotrichum gorgonifer TaxID=2041049 RepID=A0AAE8MUM4_9PEZI|nr:related to proliferation associated SNF2-like protein [Cephalotrichum gorgonifer]